MVAMARIWAITFVQFAPVSFSLRLIFNLSAVIKWWVLQVTSFLLLRLVPSVYTVLSHRIQIVHVTLRCSVKYDSSRSHIGRAQGEVNSVRDGNRDKWNGLRWNQWGSTSLAATLVFLFSLVSFLIDDTKIKILLFRWFSPVLVRSD